MAAVDKYYAKLKNKRAIVDFLKKQLREQETQLAVLEKHFTDAQNTKSD